MNEATAAEIVEALLDRYDYWSKEFEALELAIHALRRMEFDRD